MLEHQEGVCAICGKPETVKSRKGEVLALAIDHDHATGKVRGLLCFRCNTTLGTYERNVTSFQAYLFASASPEQEISQLENQLLVIENNIPLADSREIALDLGTSHKSFRELLQDKQSHIEKHFGVLRFLTAKPSSGSTGGRPEKYALLTEEQAYYALTFCDNTDKAMELRAKLIKAFMEAKEQIAALQKQLAQPQELPLAGGDSFLSDVRTLLNVPTLKELQAVERYIRAAKAFYSHKDGEITAQPTTKQLFAPKADKNTIEYVQAQILKHLNNHGPLTFNTLYHSYMKNRDEMTARKALDALVEQGIVQRETTSHSIKYSVDAYSQQA
jgi:phage regulator Rha-like protein